MNPRGQNIIERSIETLNQSSPIELFKNNPYLLFVYKKTERILAAVYIVTKSISDNESIKHHVRDTACGLLSDVLAINNSVSVDIGHQNFVHHAGLLQARCHWHQYRDHNGINRQARGTTHEGSDQNGHKPVLRTFNRPCGHDPGDRAGKRAQ